MIDLLLDVAFYVLSNCEGEELCCVVSRARYVASCVIAEEKANKRSVWLQISDGLPIPMFKIFVCIFYIHFVLGILCAKNSA